LFFYLSKLLFSGFLIIKVNSVHDKTENVITKVLFLSAGGINVPTPNETASSSATTGVHEAATPGVNQQTSEFCGLCCNQVTLLIVISQLQTPARDRSTNLSPTLKDFGETNLKVFGDLLSCRTIFAIPRIFEELLILKYIFVVVFGGNWPLTESHGKRFISI